MQERIEKLEAEKIELVDWINANINSINKKIHNLEQHKNYQIDENRKISSKVEDVENIGIEDKLDQLDERFHALNNGFRILEKYVCEIGDNVTRQALRIDSILMQDVQLQVREIERRLNVHTEVLNRDRVAPFKCPVCGGIGAKLLLYGTSKQCHPCEGKGVLWK